RLRGSLAGRPNAVSGVAGTCPRATPVNRRSAVGMAHKRSIRLQCMMSFPTVSLLLFQPSFLFQPICSDSIEAPWHFVGARAYAITAVSARVVARCRRTAAGGFRSGFCFVGLRGTRRFGPWPPARQATCLDFIRSSHTLQNDLALSSYAAVCTQLSNQGLGRVCHDLCRDSAGVRRRRDLPRSGKPFTPAFEAPSQEKLEPGRNSLENVGACARNIFPNNPTSLSHAPIAQAARATADVCDPSSSVPTARHASGRGAARRWCAGARRSRDVVQKMLAARF